MKTILILFLVVILTSCESMKLREHVFPIPEDTFTKEIKFQDKKYYVIGDVTVDNMFDGARMNDFQKINDNLFRVVVSPENFPINDSAYFAFRIKSERKRNIDLEIEYTESEHRYIPKLSYDAIHWKVMKSNQFNTKKAPNLATLRLTIDTLPLYVCGQELLTSSNAQEWTETISCLSPEIRMGVAGKSKMGRDIYYFDIDYNSKNEKPAIVVFSRLHPPEVTGYLAMQAFVEYLLEDTDLAKLFRERYRILVYPMLNPDGVDLGHWRHGAGGVDLNRDWGFYRQQETMVVANHVVQKIKEGKNEVVLGLDFHSTQEDVYYTLTDNCQSNIFGFKDVWLEGIDEAFPDYSPNDEPYDLSQPITKGWFYLQFGAEGIIYEVGDEVPRDFVKAKAQVAAREMMKLLVLREVED